MYAPLQTREVFHLLFLRALTRSVPLSSFVLKGGSNLRFFFGSIRYSEDMDLDVHGIAVHILREKVAALLTSPGLADTLRTYGIERLQPPNLSRAKQTETAQRFKIHLLTTAGEDLSTKVEFSRRGRDPEFRAEPVASPILAAYRLSPIIVPHYSAAAALRQKIRALVERLEPEARDVFDLYTLSSHPEIRRGVQTRGHAQRTHKDAVESIYSIGYQQYRDTVVNFLAPEDRPVYDSAQTWDEIRLQAVALLQEGVLP